MVGDDPVRLTRTVVAALQQTGERGLLVSGWGGMAAAELPETVFHAEGVPYDWLFPRVAAVVHHGGTGTTGLGLRAGKATVVCPYFNDQPFWGKVVHDLGVGPAPATATQANGRAAGGGHPGGYDGRGHAEAGGGPGREDPRRGRRR